MTHSNVSDELIGIEYLLAQTSRGVLGVVNDEEVGQSITEGEEEAVEVGDDEESSDAIIADPVAMISEDVMYKCSFCDEEFKTVADNTDHFR
jgi:hypothetical protein